MLTNRILPVAIHKVHSAFPVHRVSQVTCRDEMVKFIDSRPVSLGKQKQKMIDWFTQTTKNAGISQKNMHFTPDMIHNRRNYTMLIQEAFDEGKRLILPLKKKSLDEAEIEEKELKKVFLGTEVTNSVNLDVYTHYTPGCNPFLENDPMTGQGCIGGAKNLMRAYHYLQTHPEAAVQVVNLDLYSRLWAYAFPNIIDEMLPQIDDPEKLSVLRSALMMAIIIGDAATVTTLVGSEHRHFDKWANKQGYPTIHGAVQAVLPGTIDTVNVLSRPYGPVPLLREAISTDGTKVLGSAVEELKRSCEMPKELDFYCLHPGGIRVLKAVESTLGVPKELLKYAYDTLDEYGNCASPTVILELQKIMSTSVVNPTGTDIGILTGMGPGMTGLALFLKRNKLELN
jgi:alkylresorcinol/alkylpyrone synthase